MSHSRCACLSVCLCVSTAVVSRWSSHCSSVRRTCLASARESTRNCATVASTLERPTDICPRLLPTGFFGIVYARPDTHGHWRTQSVTQTNTVWLPCFPRMPQSLSLWTLDTESRDAVTRLCWHSTASQSECFFLLFFFFNANLKRTTDVAPYWPPAKNAGPEHFCFDFEFCHQTSREFQPQQLVFDWGCRRWSGLDQ